MEFLIFITLKKGFSNALTTTENSQNENNKKLH